MDTKRCPRCGETHPTSAFYRNKAAHDGLCPYCKECTKAAVYARRAANPEREREVSKRSREKNAEKIREERLARVNTDAYREQRRTYRAAHPEYREKAAATTRAWYAAMTPEQRKEWVRAKNAKKTVEQRRLERQRHDARYPEKRAAFDAKKHAKRKGALIVERVERAVVWERDGGICGICGEPADLNDWHLDHVVPLARGGEHSYANVQVSHPFCNDSKGAKLDGWRAPGSDKRG